MQRGRKVLIIDDDPEWHLILRSALDGEYEVETTDQDSFWPFISKDTYDFAILDINMPRKDGKEVFEELRLFDQRCVIVVLTVQGRDSESVKWFTERNIIVFSKLDESDYSEKIASYIKTYEFKERKELSALIVDDDPENRHIYAKLLEDRGITEISLCSSIEEAEQKLVAHSYDIYVIDILFPDSSGNLFPTGQKLVKQILKSLDTENSVIIPVTIHDVARNILPALKSSFNVRPIFREQTEDLTDVMEMILQRGPFVVRMQHV